ncbi:hypothetical protein I587_00343 [Enterococcus mundtii ATCC 882]|nr:hypothetical protein UAC_02495 [Enterococcus mundtii ATCC 882]EOU11823.1 hypothetical protein I587_00343 [Enterococcus mundtii ATCC 882]
MPLIHLTTGVLVMLDILAWFIFHLVYPLVYAKPLTLFLNDIIVRFVPFEK